MNTVSERAVLAVVILLIDALVFVVPISGIFASYILLVRPPWFRAWVGQLYQDI
jgi:hypothetical protein